MTAEEFYQDNEPTGQGIYKQEIIDFAIKFAKMHVQEALCEAADKINPTEENLELTNSILNAYSLNNIK